MDAALTAAEVLDINKALSMSREAHLANEDFAQALACEEARLMLIRAFTARFDTDP